MLYFYKFLPWLVIETHGSKLSIIKIYFYPCIAILCPKMSRVTWALKSYNLLIELLGCQMIKLLQNRKFNLFLFFRFSEISSRQTTSTPPESSGSPSGSSEGSKPGISFPFPPTSISGISAAFNQQQNPNMVISPFGHPGPSGSMHPPPHLLQSLEALHQHHLKLVSADQVMEPSL